MHSHEIYHYLKFLDCDNLEQMLADLQELKERINDSMDDSMYETVGSEVDRCYGLAQVEGAIVMAINAIEYAKSSDLRALRVQFDYCLELRKAVRNSVFVNSRDIDG